MITISSRWFRPALFITLACIGSAFLMLQSLISSNRGQQLSVLIGTFCWLFSISFWWFSKPARFKAFLTRYVPRLTPGDLGFIRAIVCFVTLFLVLFLEDIQSSAALPMSMREIGSHQAGFGELLLALPGADAFLSSYWALTIFEIVLAIVLFGAMVGYKTRWTIPTSTALYFLFGAIARSHDHFYHSGVLNLYFLFVLCFAPCGDGFSIDRVLAEHKIKRQAGKSTLSLPDSTLPTFRYGLPLYFCWVTTALTYIAAGSSKLRNGGFLWAADALNMRYHLYKGPLDAWHPYGWGLSLKFRHAPDLLYSLLGYTGIAIELLAIFLLFSKVARLILPSLLAGFHVGILAFQNILFFELILLLPLIFIEPKVLRQGMARIGSALWKARAGGTAVHLADCPTNDARPENQSLKREFVHIPVELYALGLSIIVAIILGAHISKTEHYPLTAFQMFSRRNSSGETSYVKSTIAYDAQGNALPVDLTSLFHVFRVQGIGVNAKRCFSDKARDISACDDFMAASIRRIRDVTDFQAARFEMHLWHWDFENNSSDEDFGELAEVRSLELNEFNKESD